jgi:hypothetical protein
MLHLIGQSARDYVIVDIGKRTQEVIATDDPEHIKPAQRIDGIESLRSDKRGRWFEDG